jgi:phospholipid/cholesterol/gamma-HCH transport system ATP-binding protein
VCIKHMVGLLYPDDGDVVVHGESVPSMHDFELFEMRKKFGVLFQDGALFGSMNLLDNVAFPLRQHTDKGEDEILEIVGRRLSEVGLSTAGDKFPNELSGGMRKRAALARAIALDPEVLFLDEPTAGLDPLSAAGFDELVRHLKALLGPTMVIVSHDLDLLWRVADRVAFMADGRVVGVGTMEELSRTEHPVLREYFVGPRGRGAMEQSWKRR